jgi:adenylate cyclase
MSRIRGTLLWIDIPGLAARIASQPYAEAARTGRICRAFILPVCEAFSGRLGSTVGDSLLVIFRRPTDALLAGAAVQDRAAQRSRAGEEALDLRICAVSGELRVDRNGVLGDLVDLASRVRGAAGRGDVVLTGDVFAGMDHAQLSAEELGDADGVPGDVRLYRLARNGRSPELPYGGTALAKAGPLPAVTGDGILEGRPPVWTRSITFARGLATTVAPLARRAAGAVSARWRRLAAALPAGVRELGRTASARLARIPLRIRLVGAAVALAAASVALFLSARSDPLDRALAQRDFRAARSELKQIKDEPARAYGEGRIQEARGSFAPAAASYASAARSGDRRGLKQLIRMTENGSCEVRATAARALGELGDADALPALHKLERGRFADERGKPRPFRCSSRRAAREALEQLRSRPG